MRCYFRSMTTEIQPSRRRYSVSFTASSAAARTFEPLGEGARSTLTFDNSGDTGRCCPVFPLGPAVEKVFAGNLHCLFCVDLFGQSI